MRAAGHERAPPSLVRPFDGKANGGVLGSLETAGNAGCLPGGSLWVLAAESAFRYTATPLHKI